MWRMLRSLPNAICCRAWSRLMRLMPCAGCCRCWTMGKRQRTAERGRRPAVAPAIATKPALRASTCASCSGWARSRCCSRRATPRRSSAGLLRPITPWRAACGQFLDCLLRQKTLGGCRMWPLVMKWPLLEPVQRWFSIQAAMFGRRRISCLRLWIRWKR